VNHAVGNEIRAYNQYGYKIIDIHGDIAIRGWAPWIIVEKTNSENEIITLTHEFVSKFKDRNENTNPLFITGDTIEIFLPKVGSDAYFYIGVEKEEENFWISIEQINGEGEQIQYTEHEVIIKNFETDVSQKVQTLKTLILPEAQKLRIRRPLDEGIINSRFSIYERFVIE
jgi:hypothetical protein